MVRKFQNPLLFPSCLIIVGSRRSKGFRIQNVGKVFIRVDSNGVETLVHAEILLQGPSIFIKLDVNPEQWPFLIRNKSSCAIDFGQTVWTSSFHCLTACDR